MTYKDLKSFQQATLIYDFTVEFCKRYIKRFSRTVDQMEQAARSGKQNIVEGTAVSKTSPQTELKLMGVARGSLKELLEDYEDFLRQQNLSKWDKDDSRAIAMRQLAYGIDRSDKTDRTDKSDRSDKTDRSDRFDKIDKTGKTYKSYTTYGTYKSYLDNPEQAANTMITLINQTTYLLDQQIRAIRNQLDEKGIMSEPRQQQAMRILKERKSKDREFDEYLKKILKKGSEKDLKPKE
jgi:restriction system protein